MLSAIDIIKKLNLQPLPFEGGYYRETYRSDHPGIPARQIGIASDSKRQLCTAIYYLVTPISFSELHRVRSDEIFHFYAGDTVEMIQISEQAQLTRTIIGNRIMHGEHPQVLVPKHVWQGLRLTPGGSWALMGTTVSPGFEFEDFELGVRDQLLAQFPSFRDEILMYTKEQPV